MAVPVTHVRFHTKEAAAGIIADAWEIAGDLDLPQDERRATFEKAVDLLASGVALTSQPSFGDSLTDFARGMPPMTRGGR